MRWPHLTFIDASPNSGWQSNVPQFHQLEQSLEGHSTVSSIFWLMYNSRNGKLLCTVLLNKEFAHSPPLTPGLKAEETKVKAHLTSTLLAIFLSSAHMFITVPQPSQVLRPWLRSVVRYPNPFQGSIEPAHCVNNRLPRINVQIH